MPKKRFGALAVILIVVALLVIGGGAWYYIHRSNVSSQSEAPSAATATKVASTANWPTFTNAEYNLQVKYPQGWQAQNLSIACMGATCNDGDYIGPGVDISSTTSSSGSEDIVVALNDKTSPPISTSTCVYVANQIKVGEVQIGSNSFCESVTEYDGSYDGDWADYVNAIRNAEGDVLSEKYLPSDIVGNYAYTFTYTETSPDPKTGKWISASMDSTIFSSEIVQATDDYYKQNGVLPPPYSATDTAAKSSYAQIVAGYKTTLQSEENTTQEILSTVELGG